MPEERLTKNDKREQAREAARVAREKQKRAERIRRWVIPSSITVVLIAIAAVVVLVISNTAPAPQTAAGPKNMISDGIVLTGASGAMVATPTAAIKKKGTPTATTYDQSDGIAHIVTYVDFSCPACQSFEATNAETIKSLVEGGQATIEIHPVAILDRNFQGSRYSSRANNVGACVANFAPDSFYDVMEAMYTNQGTEGTTGLTNAQMIRIVHNAGLTDSKVDSCINGETFKSWVASATVRATSGPLPNTSVANVGGTPTVLVNGQQYSGSLTSGSDFTSFLEQVLSS